MRTPWDRPPSLRDAIEAGGGTPACYLIGSGHRAFGDLIFGSAVEPDVENLRGRSVLIALTDPFLVAIMMIELDGLARRMTLYPFGLSFEHVNHVVHCADVDVMITDGNFPYSLTLNLIEKENFTCNNCVIPRVHADRERLPTEWILLSSGTAGTPKMVLHTLASLAGAIRPREPDTDVTWCTFYDICRYGGLQIYLRAVLTRSTLLLTKPREMVADFLQRAGEAGVTHISGTPSHWRRVLMSPDANRIAPRYIRLSGEIADQAILNNLHTFYPHAEIIHAFASTEAGVAFEVCDALSGFPASMLTGTSGVDMKVVDSTLRVRSSRTAERYLGEDSPELKDLEGFVDTGDVLELRDGRYHFQGRRDGVINVGGHKVHPEEVETVLNGHPEVRLSMVKTKRSPITGELVVADVLLRNHSVPGGEEARALEQIIMRYCRDLLVPHKVPAAIRFVAALTISEAGKLVRRNG